jgi:hypothetical protein
MPRIYGARAPFGAVQRMIEIPPGDVEILKELKSLWNLPTDSMVIRRLIEDHGRPAVYAARNSVDALRQQVDRSRPARP